MRVSLERCAGPSSSSAACYVPAPVLHEARPLSSQVSQEEDSAPGETSSVPHIEHQVMSGRNPLCL